MNKFISMTAAGLALAMAAGTANAGKIATVLSSFNSTNSSGSTESATNSVVPGTVIPPLSPEQGAAIYKKAANSAGAQIDPVTGSATVVVTVGGKDVTVKVAPDGTITVLNV